MKRFVIPAIGLGVLAIGMAVAATVTLNAKRSPSRNPSSAAAPEGHSRTAQVVGSQSGSGMAAIAAAAQANRYLFMLFWKSDDETTRSMRGTLESVVKQVSAKAASVSISIDEPSEHPVVEKFDLERAPMPLILALAPNGAITAGFPTKVEQQALLQAFATPCTERCMKAVQAGKLVLLCVQNAATKLNDDALRGVRDFQADARYGHATEIFMLDPADNAEAEFLSDLKIDLHTPQAVTVFLAPPGAPVAKFDGATTKDQLIDALQKASTGCGPGGCGPGGCGPKR